jgi:hypothetical protein
MREQRKWFKNLRIHHTEISTATVFLEQQWQLKSTTESNRARLEMQTESFNLNPEESLRISKYNSQTSGTISKTFKEVDVSWKATLQLILEELGLEADELQDSSAFTDLGVDSLFQLILLGRMREQF